MDDPDFSWHTDTQLSQTASTNELCNFEEEDTFWILFESYVEHKSLSSSKLKNTKRISFFFIIYYDQKFCISQLSYQDKT